MNPLIAAAAIVAVLALAALGVALRVARRSPVDLASHEAAETEALTKAREALDANYAQVQTEIDSAIYGEGPEDALAASFNRSRRGRP